MPVGADGVVAPGVVEAAPVVDAVDPAVVDAAPDVDAADAAVVEAAPVVETALSGVAAEVELFEDLSLPHAAIPATRIPVIQAAKTRCLGL